MPCGIFWILQKMWNKLHEVKTQISEANLEILKFQTRSGWGRTNPKIFCDRFWYMERWNRSSYVKVMAVLRTDSELEDKTVRKWEKFAAVARNWWKTVGKNTRTGQHTNWTVTRPNQQQDLDQDTNSMARKGCRTEKWYDTGLMRQTQEHSKLRVDVNLTVYMKLWLPLDENKGGLIFRKVLVSGFRTTRPEILQFFLIFWYFFT